MTPDEGQAPRPHRSPETAPAGRKSADDPPVVPRTLTDLFAAARTRVVQPTGLNPAYSAGEVVGAAIEAVRRGLDEDLLDPHTRHQLTHVLNALSTAVTETVRAVLPRQPGAPTTDALRRTAAGSGANETKPKKRFADALKGTLGKKPTPHPSSEAHPPAAPRSSSALALDAVGKALPHVEKAFARRPAAVGPPAPPWYEHDVMMELIQDLVSLRERGREERVWDRVGVFREMLRAQGIEILAYDPAIRPERQADAFQVEQVTQDAANLYETDLPALVMDPDGEHRRVLVRGRALRLPATTAPAAPAAESDQSVLKDAPNEPLHDAQNEENDR
ncbi:hypothetical protein ABZ626_30745 [Streptomyces longispororuber]|uniref:hypothetical protein n=1 Tax=Streptomyces longispororuber TaxID=68230 RepID=UPI0033C9ED54